MRMLQFLNQILLFVVLSALITIGVVGYIALDQMPPINELLMKFANSISVSLF